MYDDGMADETILSFPIQKEEPADDKLTDQEMVFQLKLKASTLLNAVAAGTYIPTMLNIRSLLELNELCHQVGIPPMDFDIEAVTRNGISHEVNEASS